MDDQIQQALAKAQAETWNAYEMNAVTTRLSEAIQEVLHLLMQPFIELGRSVHRAFTLLVNGIRIRLTDTKVTFVRGRYQLTNNRFLLKRGKVIHAKPRARKKRR